MKILCFGDSNTYGYDPHSYYGGRYSPENRWVDILAEKLNCELLNYGQNGLSIPDNEYAAKVYESIFIKEKADLMAEIMSLKQELRNSKLSVEVARNNVDNTEVTNVDIIKRLSQLEKMVYGLKTNIEKEDN